MAGRQGETGQGETGTAGRAGAAQTGAAAQAGGTAGQGASGGGAGARISGGGPASVSVRLPFVSASVTLPQLRAQLAGLGAGRGQVENVGFYGGLAALGALGILEWPVALVAAGGTYALSRLPGSRQHRTHPGHDHTHNQDCEHDSLGHDGHVDYLHDGHRHAAHGEH